MKFPLQLSCGHFTNSSCECRSERTYKNTGESPIDKALAQFQGNWRQVLGNYCCTVPSGKRHGPCPVCGGKDRFRFDDKDGRGTWYCSQCEPSSGGGLLLLSRFIGKSTIETAKELVGDDDYKTVAPKRIHTVNYDDVRAINIEKAKKGALTLFNSAVLSSHKYMDNKGLNGEWLTNGQAIMTNNGVVPACGFLLVPVYKKGELVNMQKITVDGIKRPLFGGDMQGVQHVIDGSAKNVAITEGYATGITINLATKWKTYAAFNAGNLEAAVKQAKAEHPAAKIVVFGDHDELDPAHNRRPGEYYAAKAAAPHGADVALPPSLGDWDDYRQANGMDALKTALREAISKDRGVFLKKEVLDTPKIISLPQPAQKPAPAFGSWMGTDNSADKKNPQGGGEKLVSDMPSGVAIDHVNIDKPPGIAGDIVKYMKKGAHRELEGGAYTAMALQCIAMAGAGIDGFMGTKTSLITITLGLSASGKDRPQKVIKDLLAASDIKVYGDIRSDKDIIRAAVYDGGRCFYVKDEAHSLLAATSRQDKHSANIPATLMELATTTLMPLSRLHLDEFQSQIMLKVARLEKIKSAKEDIKLGYNVELEKEKIKKIDHELKQLEVKINEHNRIMDSLESGIKNPCLNLAASSTPQKMASIIDEDAIESGFLGRALIFDCGSERSHRNFNLWGKKTHDDKQDRIDLDILKSRVGAIAQMAGDTSQSKIDAEFVGREYKMTASSEANKLMFDISLHYDQHHYINHNRLGALYARLPERVISVASILAMDNLIDGNLLIESEFVLYALKLALLSIEHLNGNLRVNEAVDGNTVEDKLAGIKMAIVKRLTVPKSDKAEGWRYKSYLKEYLKRQKYYQEISKDLLEHGQDAMENAIAVLKGEGKIMQDDKKVRLSDRP
jgi:putative DNA primase/helicase